MSVLVRLKEQVKDAMVVKDTVRRDLFRCVLNEAQMAAMKNGKDLTDDQVYKLMKIIVNNNNKTLHGYTDENGDFKPGIDQRIVNATGADLEACETQRTKLNTENDLLNALIPKTLTLDEVRAMLAPVADAIKAAAGDKPAMGVAMPIFKKGGHIVESSDVAAVVQEIRA